MGDTGHEGKTRMPGTYKTAELVGTSPESFAGAVKSAAAEASKPICQMDWFEVVAERGRFKIDR
jgi:flavin-binding protein dodecin